MISSEVQRTLVKSPPELWTELSDPAALGRHLGEFGEIRITRVEPEKTVEWETENASGRVLIKPSGWGTRVTLTATREIPAPETPPAPEAIVEAPPQLVALDSQPEPQAGLAPEAQAQRELAPEAQAQRELTPEAQGELTPESQGELAPETAVWQEIGLAYEAEQEPETTPEPRRGFLARLFRRRRVEQPIEPASPPAVAEPQKPEESLEAVEDGEATVEWSIEDGGVAPAPSWAQATVPAPEPVEPVAAAEPVEAVAAAEPVEVAGEAQEGGEQSESAEGPSDISAELEAAEEITEDEVTAVLTSMLDRLGTAHHRPFSRS
jgi:hypothetical protein